MRNTLFHTSFIALLCLLFGAGACSDQGALDGAGITANSSVNLNDGDNSSPPPAVVVFGGNPTSTSQDTSLTLNVPVDIIIDLRGSQRAMSAILWNATIPTISVELTFIDVDNKHFIFPMDPIPKVGSLSITTNKRYPLPFAVEKLAKIEMKVDGVLVATYP